MTSSMYELHFENVDELLVPSDGGIDGSSQSGPISGDQPWVTGSQGVPFQLPVIITFQKIKSL